MHLILTGATGRVGSAVLDAMLRNPSITKISVLSRSPVPQTTDSEEAKRKCNVIIHTDFEKPPPTELFSLLAGAKGCVWAQGISIREVSPPMYEKITYDFPIMWAEQFAKSDQVGEAGKFNFVYVSGEGATTTPGMITPAFGKVKGRAEKALLDLSKEQQFQKLRVFSARPGAVDNFHQLEIQKYSAGKSTGLRKYSEIAFTPVVRTFFKSMNSPTKELGDVLVQLAAGDGMALLPRSLCPAVHRLRLGCYA